MGESDLRGVVPVLRIADARVAAAWYERLGFEVEWEHRFEPGLPLFVSIRRGDARIFLSEHTGDAPQNGLVYLYVDDLSSIGIEGEATEYGMVEAELVDPDGNRIRDGARA